MTLYEILEVSENASNEVIEKAYKTLAKKYHPDLQTTSEEKKNADIKMKEINEAYATLKDENKRSKYDNKLRIEREKAEVSHSNATSHFETTKTNIQHQDNSKQTKNVTYKTPAEWQQILANLSPKEREKLKKKITREAREEYTRVAEDYYRQKGYVVRHKTTPKEYLNRFIAVMIIIAAVLILWIIPFSRRWLISFYENNIVLKLFVDIIIQIVKVIIGRA